ncbi:MAG: AMP-dependent synthetase/ligase [Spirochaetales bacterium]
MKRTVLAMLGNAVSMFGDKPYCWRKTNAGWSASGFQTIQQNARHLAQGLRARGVTENAHVAILAEGSPEWVTFEFGVLTNHGASVPLSIKLLAGEVPFRVNHSEAVAIGVSKNQAAKLGSVYNQLERKPIVVALEPNTEDVEAVAAAIPGATVAGIYDLIEEGKTASQEVAAAVTEAIASIDEDSVATVSYTSGTTGNPKGIMLTHLNYYANCHDSIELFQVPLGFRTLVILPCDHSFAHTVGIYAALVRGIELFFVDARGGGMAILRNIPKNIVETNPTFLLTVPSLSGSFMKKITQGVSAKGRFANAIFTAGLRAGIRRNGDGVHRPGVVTRFLAWFPHTLAELLVFRKIRTMFGSEIRFFVGGGALLDIGQQQFFMAIGLPVYQGYGLTEAAPVISSNAPRSHKLGTSGRIAPSVTVRITKEDGSEAAPGEAGEICVRGENVMKGYFKNPEASAEALRDGWLYTGDLGYIDADGFLMVTGRAKALLIGPDGEKYSPETIEETIMTHGELINHVVAYNDHQKYTVAVCTLDESAVRRLIEGGEIREARQVLAHVAESFFAYREAGIQFPAQWTPATFIIESEQFTEENHMINSTMKIVRHKVADTFADDIAYLYSDAGNKIENERNLASIRKLFGVS